MRWHAQRTLGLAFQDEAIHVAEVHVSGNRTVISRTGTFRPPVEAADPAAVGKAFAQFLKGERFTARSAGVGVPARWLMTKQVALPPADASARAGMLRIQAERAFASAAGDLAVDYVAGPEVGDRSTVLLCAVPRERVDRALAIARAAGLAVSCVTPTVAALVRAGSRDENGAARVALNVVPGSIEIAIQAGDRLESVRHVAPPAPASKDGGGATDRLAVELRRILMTRADGERGEARLTIWDGAGSAEGMLEQVQAALATDASETGSIATLADLNGSRGSSPEGFAHAGAIALARAAIEPALVAVDFLNSRLRAPAARRFGIGARVAAGVGLALLLFIGWRVVEWQLASLAVGSLEREIQAQASVVSEARAVREKVDFADGWFEARPALLECMLELSRAFPENDRIWATHVSLPQDLHGVISGQATDDGAVLAMFEKLQASPSFYEVTMHGGITYPRASGRDRNLAFSISFRLRPRR
jgi:hypothetical protein